MKREDLQKVEGLTKEQIDAIMDLHQTDVTAWNQKFENQKTELATKETKIKDLTDKINTYDGVDVKKLQDDVKDWEEKYNTDMAAEKKNAAIRLAIVASRPRNEKALMALIDTETIKLNEDGTVTGLKEQLENIKKENDYLFEPTEPTKPAEPKPQDVNLGGDHTKKPEGEALTLGGAISDFYAKEQ